MKYSLKLSVRIAIIKIKPKINKLIFKKKIKKATKYKKELVMENI